MRIGLIDYAAGNLRSVSNAFKALGARDLTLVSTPGELAACDKIVLPGVGAFPKAMRHLGESGLAEALDREVRRGKLFLGICLGMQLAMDFSLELGRTEGFGWVRGGVTPFPRDMGLSVPHVGWNDVRRARTSALLADLPESTDFYFVHGFYVSCDDPGDVLLWCNYGMDFAAAIQKDNVMGTQFHPEKSQTHGLKLLENFMNMPC